MLGWQKEMKLNRNRQRGNSDWRARKNRKAMYTKVESRLQPQAWLSETRESWITTRKWWQRLGSPGHRTTNSSGKLIFRGHLIWKWLWVIKPGTILKMRTFLLGTELVWSPQNKQPLKARQTRGHQVAMLGLDAYTRSHWGEGQIKHRLMGKGKQQKAWV